jgi:hypothetical protein
MITLTRWNPAELRGPLLPDLLRRSRAHRRAGRERASNACIKINAPRHGALIDCNIPLSLERKKSRLPGSRPLRPPPARSSRLHLWDAGTPTFNICRGNLPMVDHAGRILARLPPYSWHLLEIVKSRNAPLAGEGHCGGRGGDPISPQRGTRTMPAELPWIITRPSRAQGRG